LHRHNRFAEKLATPDVTVADIIGDVDPIKSANLKMSYADDRVIHYGMIPRANRCIFVINELPDLQARIQVALFNILQEGDIQIRGFKLRLPLDMQFLFTANPEDYTNRGSIVTPLKDRIGSQILTHYPESVEIAKTITSQEAKLVESQAETVYVPDLAKDLLEQISFEARESEYVDVKSGISARMSITAYENLISTAERRALLAGDENTSVRLSDFIGIIPAITGKVELVYEGEQEGADFVANELLNSAIKTLFQNYFPKVEKLEKQGEETPYDDLISWFFNGDGFELLDDFNDTKYKAKLDEVKPLDTLIADYQPEIDPRDVYFEKEFILWGLTQFKKLSKYRYSEGLKFQDPYGSYISGL
jgi:magnesium chelatase subunit I